MGNKDAYATGVPCWVDALQPDPRAALEFYGPLLGWSFGGLSPSSELAAGEYFTARLGGRRVAGIGQSPTGIPAVWLTYVRVDDVAGTAGRVEAAGGARFAGPMDAASGGRFAVLTDPGGVPFGVWEAERSGAELVSAPGAWAMSSLHSTDPERDAEFYGTVFGWAAERVPGASFSKWYLGGEVVAVLGTADGVDVPAHWSVNFAVRDADAVAKHAHSLGGAVLMEPFDTPGFRNTVVADPQGGVIAISAQAG